MKRSPTLLIAKLGAKRSLPTLSLALAVVGVSACTPRVEIAAPEKPITINMNVKIDHEVRVKVERDLEEVINKESGLF